MKKIFSILTILFCICLLPFQLGLTEFYNTFTVEHLFTHCLMAYPEIVYLKGNPMTKYYDEDCITSSEFKNMLFYLEKNNYILVNINDIYKVEKGIAVKKAVKLPKGKKALILSFDDVNYDHKKLGNGMVDKIVIKNNKLYSETNLNGYKDYSLIREFIPILEQFIESHPSFSINNAKGIINLTGYDGILGYRTQSSNTQSKSEIKKAKPVVNKLKQNGWTFACHSYGHYHMNKITNEKFAIELEKWKKEVEPIVGKTEIYVYP